MEEIPKNWTEEDYFALFNPEAFARRFLKRELHPFQKTIVRNAQDKKRIVVLCARQLGKTEVISIYATWYMFANANKKILIFAPKYEQAVDNLFARIRDFIKDNSKLMDLVYREPTTGKQKLGVDFVKLSNGSSVRAMSASKDANIEGWTGDLILIDESQSVSDITFYKKIMPMVTATDGSIIQIGTPRSRNHFYQCYQDNKIWTVLEYDWTHGTAKYKKNVRQNKNIMPAEDFRTEYELKWIDEDALYFTSDEITNAIEEYDLPFVTNADKFIGIDLASKQDKTIITIVAQEADTYRVIDLHVLGGDYSQQKKYILRVIDRYNPIMTYIDGTGLGVTFLDFLREEARKPYKIEGYTMSSKNKVSELYPNAKLLFSNKRVILPADPNLENELRDLRKTVTQHGTIQIHHPPRGHDDYCDSLALALLAAKPFDKKASGPFVVNFVDNFKKGSISSSFKKIKRTKEGVKVFLIGQNGEEIEEK